MHRYMRMCGYSCNYAIIQFSFQFASNYKNTNRILFLLHTDFIGLVKIKIKIEKKNKKTKKKHN